MDSQVELLSGRNLAALMTLPGIGEKRALDLAGHYQTWEAFLATTEAELATVVGNATARKLTAPSDHNPSGFPSEPLTPNLPAGHYGPVRLVSRFEPGYPTRLLTIQDPPLLLWYTGTLPPTDGPSAVAVVGTRTPDTFGASVARLVANEAALRGHPTISGLALGCDSIGHTACLDAGQPTWAILGQGVDTLPLHGDRASLARRIITAGGGLISEVPPGTPVAAHLLTKRNRLQAGLAHAVFIAQTGLAADGKPAGTLHTARYAIDQGRYLVVAAPPANLAAKPENAGNVALTNPAGCEPEAIHATSPALREVIKARKPLADLSLTGPSDLDLLWRHLAAQ